MKLFDIGGGFDLITATPDQNDSKLGPNNENTNTRTTLGPALWLGFNFPILQPGENFSLGISPNVQFNFFGNQNIWSI